MKHQINLLSILDKNKKNNTKNEKLVEQSEIEEIEIEEDIIQNYM
jgi:hypothetical protein